MRDDRPSSTAAIVAAARAEIHRNPTVRGFSDPYAEQLLPRSYSTSFTSRVIRRMSRLGSHLFALRTVAIDEGIRHADRLAQLVVLGAGLDARAWRMEELQSVPVFEVDHPATQRYKQRKAQQFEDRPDHHYIAVDFEKDSLDERLETGGHRSDIPTVWVWEGVTMYLPLEAIESTLDIVRRRSATGSRVLITYLPPSPTRSLVGLGTRVLSEPFRACFRPAEMAALLDRYGFDVVSDESGVDWHRQWGIGLRLPALVSNTERLVVADARG